MPRNDDVSARILITSGCGRAREEEIHARAEMIHR